MDHCNEIINIDSWERIERYGLVYPEGTREKSVYRSPGSPPLDFIRPSHNYLFKKSRPAFPWQFYIEIIAYRIGTIMGVRVPPTYAGMLTEDTPGEPVYAALIEWFYDDGGDEGEDYIDGGKVIGPYIPNFDYRKGRQHNLKTIIEQAERSPQSTEIIEEFASILTFDTVIGNTDRHHENWGIVYDFRGAESIHDERHPFKTPFGWMRLSPAFDNGTSMLYNIREVDIHKFDDLTKRREYLTRITGAQNPKGAMHHMKWDLSGDAPLNFFDFMKRLALEYPHTKPVILSRLEFSQKQLEDACRGLVGIARGNEELSERRLMFIIATTMERRDLLLEALE